MRTEAFKKWFGDWEAFFKKNFLINGNPVANTNSSAFLPKNGVTFVEQVTDYFAKVGGKVNSAFGEVILDKKSVKNSYGHGMGVEKRAAFTAVKDVLENGVVVLPMDNYSVHGKKQQTGMVAAPITIDGERYICVVEVIWNNIENRLYTHEVTLQKISLVFVLILPKHKVQFQLLTMETLQSYYKILYLQAIPCIAVMIRCIGAQRRNNA